MSNSAEAMSAEVLKAKALNSVVQEPSLSLREQRRQQRIDLNREHILATAETMFAERGFHGTGLKEVAARCEFSVGSIYSFFQNKEKLFEDVLLRRTPFQGEAVRICAPESMPADERLVAIAKRQIQDMQEYPDWNIIAVDTARTTQMNGTMVPEVYRLYLRQAIAFLQGVVEQGQREGSVRDGDSETLAQLYYTILTSYISNNLVFGSTVGTTPDVDLYLDFIRQAFSTRR